MPRKPCLPIAGRGRAPTQYRDRNTGQILQSPDCGTFSSSEAANSDTQVAKELAQRNLI